jgi:hypothetical protein
MKALESIEEKSQNFFWIRLSAFSIGRFETFVRLLSTVDVLAPK